MRRSRVAVVGGTVAAVVVGGLVFASLAARDDAPARADSTEQPATSEPSPGPSGEPGPEASDASDPSGEMAEDPVHEAVASPESLCTQVTAADFTSLTGVPVSLDQATSELQCDYVSEEPDGSFGRVTARVPDDFTTWEAYVATQPDGDQVSRPDIADGAIVIVVDTGGSMRYVTAEAALGSTVITWELALPGTVEEAREQGTDLLELVTSTAEDRS